MKYDTNRSKQCNYSVAQPQNTGYSPLINEGAGDITNDAINDFFKAAVKDYNKKN